MRKEDKKKIETLLGKNDSEKHVMARFFYNTKKCILYPYSEIEYNSLETIRFEKVIDVEGSEYKSVKTLKEFFPTVEKVFVYYTCLDGGYRIKDELEAGGWKTINNSVTVVNGEERVTPMYETSCYFIFAVPKGFKIDIDRNTEVNGITVNG